jgi:phospholipid/cholesterol/gamma-HCH transport system permease protein
MGNMLVVLILRELGPLITVLVVIARSGTAVASELGNMKVNSEITLLESVGINPLSYIVFPRILGGVLSVVCLGFSFCMVAFFGGYFVVNLIHPLSFEFFTDALALAITKTDILMFLIKNIFSGLLIFSIACYHGMSVRKSFTEVPQMTTRAVMASIVYTVVFNGIISLSLYIQNLRQLGLL